MSAKLTMAKAEAPLKVECALVDVASIPEEITPEDEAAYAAITSTELTDEQKEWIVTPPKAHPQQEDVLAVHWHPEFVPMDLIVRRVEAMYPNATEKLIIPTQHNVIMSLNGYSGVEVDCYSHGFNRKVQLLLHFKNEKLENAGVLKSMLDHTFKYRGSQLFEFMSSVVEPHFDDRVQEAAGATNTDEDVIGFCRIHVAKLSKMVEDKWAETPRESIKNKLVRNYLDELRPQYGDRVVNKAQVFLKAVKDVVKRHFSLSYFYRASEIIEEARSLGCGIVIPHPEQFWPILLADYDVDGIEVWNPQSREYTEFLIQAVQRQNKVCKHGREQLVFMGDDCHMSEKTKDPALQNPEKAAREIGLQPAWDDLTIAKSLIVHSISRASVMQEYRARLA